MGEFKPGDYIISLIKVYNYRNIGTVHKIPKEGITDEGKRVYYVTATREVFHGNISTFQLATNIEVIIAKLLGTCYE